MIEDNVVQKTNYLMIREEAEKPSSERKKKIGRKGEESAIRKYHLSSEERIRLLMDAQATGGIINPMQGRVGVVWAQVEALIQLGANQWHPLKSIKNKMQEIMSLMNKKRKNKAGIITETDAWTDFYHKSAREKSAKPKDGLSRIEQNFRMLQRLPQPGRKENNPYGLKLSQFGMCIDIEYRKIQEDIEPLPYFKLNTTWGIDDEGTTIKPLFVNPNSKRRRRKKCEIRQESPAIKEVKIESLTERKATDLADIAFQT